MSLIRFSACSTGEHHEQCRRTETVRNPKIDMKKKLKKKKQHHLKNPVQQVYLKIFLSFPAGYEASWFWTAFWSMFLLQTIFLLLKRKKFR